MYFSATFCRSELVIYICTVQNYFVIILSLVSRMGRILHARQHNKCTTAHTNTHFSHTSDLAWLSAELHDRQTNTARRINTFINERWWLRRICYTASLKLMSRSLCILDLNGFLIQTGRLSIKLSPPPPTTLLNNLTQFSEGRRRGGAKDGGEDNKNKPEGKDFYGFGDQVAIFFDTFFLVLLAFNFYVLFRKWDKRPWAWDKKKKQQPGAKGCSVLMPLLFYVTNY